MEEINKIPPVTRALLAGTLGVTLPTLVHLVNPYVFLLWWPAVTRQWQVWRPITAFFFGGSGLQLVFDVFLLFRNSTDLELNTFARQTTDYAWALFLINTVILATNYPLRSPVLFRPMMMAIVYLWARANPHSSMSFFGLINTPARYVPYAYLFIDLVQGGMPIAIQSATGLMAAHIYYFLKTVLPATNGGRGPNYLPPPPSFLRNLLPDSQDPATQGQQTQPGGSMRSTDWGGTAYAPAGRSFDTGFPQAGSGSTSGGQRLNAQSTGGSGGGSGLTSWLPSFARGGGSSSQTGRGAGQQSGPDREAMLAAAEARLRSLRENSIAGRNARAAQAATQAANSPEARARAARTAETKPAPAAEAGMVSMLRSDGSESLSTGVHARSGAQAVRRPGVSSSNESSAREPASDEEQETASGSGGRVAEIRRAPGGTEDRSSTSGSDKGGNTGRGGHSWGFGQRLGE